MKIRFEALTKINWAMLPESAKPRLCDDSRGIIAFDEHDNMVAGSVMDSWTDNSCMIHVFIGNPFALKHGFAHEVFNYAFNIANRGVIIGCTPADNKKALKFNANMGFEEQTRIKDGYAEGVDFVITQLRKENCKFIAQQEKIRRVA
jgi:RimJ/RimL family protein N-acetyltransferase|tara:strand:- start:16 stop:456 length:441 start_codon:yes stop_codon:yes gene_type:complete